MVLGFFVQKRSCGDREKSFPTPAKGSSVWRWMWGGGTTIDRASSAPFDRGQRKLSFVGMERDQILRSFT